MAEKALVVGNMKMLNKYFPAYTKQFGYVGEDEALSTEKSEKLKKLEQQNKLEQLKNLKQQIKLEQQNKLKQRKQKLFKWVEQTLPTIEKIHQFITQSEQNASVFLPYYTNYKQQTTQSKQRIPFQDFQKNVLHSCGSCRQSITIQPEQNKTMRQQIRKIKTLLTKLHTTKTVPRQQQLSPPKPRYSTRSKKL